MKFGQNAIRLSTRSVKLQNYPVAKNLCKPDPSTGLLLLDCHDEV